MSPPTQLPSKHICGQGREDIIRVALVDDHPILRAGLVHTFGSRPGFEVVAEGESSAEAIEIAETLLPDLIFLDINMPGGGLHAAKTISNHCPAVRIIMLTAHDSEQHVVGAMRSGASGYVLKGVSSEELIRTAQAVHDGEAYVSPGLAAALLGRWAPITPPAKHSPGFVDLTPREEQILNLVSEGRSNKEIGESIGLTEKTVKHYMTNVLHKLHARNRVEAALIAKQRLGS